MKKKILAVFLSLCMAMSLLPVTALATEGTDAPKTQTTSLPTAGEDGVITLEGDVELSATYTVATGEDIKLDLHGYTISPAAEFTGGHLITVSEGGSLTLTDSVGGGKLESTGSSVRGILNHGTFNMDSGAINVYNYAVTNEVTQTSYNNNQPIVCNITGGELSASYAWTIFLKGAGIAGQKDGSKQGINYSGEQSVRNDLIQTSISGNAKVTGIQAITTNASNGIYAGFTLNISGNAQVVDKSASDSAIYLPAVGVTTISGNAYISGAQGIRFCAGELTITGGTIEGTDVSDEEDLIAGGSGGTKGAIVIGKAGSGYVGDVKVNISGTAKVVNIAEGTDADTRPAIVVSDKNMGDEFKGYDKLSISVNVDGATITGDVVKVSNLSSTNTQDGGNTSLMIQNTTVKGDVTNQSKTGLTVKDSAITGNVTNTSEGNTALLNTNVEGKVTDGEGTGTIYDDDNAGTTGNFVALNETTSTPYDDLATALNEAKNGDTILLVDDVTVNVPDTFTTKGQGAITINKDITLDGNGKTINIGTGFKATGGDGWDEVFGKYHVLNITSDATIQNLTIDGGWAGMGKEESANYSAARTGINIWTNAEDQLDVTLSGVTVKNCSVYAVTAKGADLTITDLTTSGNQWGVDVEDNSTVYIEGSNIPENIVYENSSADKNGLTITNGTYGNVVVQGASTNGKVTLNDGNYEGIDNKSTGGAVTIEVTDGSFKESVAQYVTSDLKYEANANGIYTYHKTLDAALAVSDTVSSVEAAKDSANAVTVTVKNGNDVDTIKLTSGTVYSLRDYPDQGYNHFVGWTDQDGNHYYGGQTVKITANTTFTAQWAYIPPANPNYRIDIPDFEGGTVTADPAAAKAGATVTLTATPDEGYAVGTITVTDRFGDAVKVTENADGTYTFTMPNGQVTVKATFVETQEPAPAEPFPDVDENDWFYDEVVYVYENGLMNGVENNQFAPNTATNRAMLATILYRLAGEPAVSGDLPFTDVAAGTWYTDAVLWAAQNGIVNGLGENTFAPMNTLTREQLVTMLYRYAEAEGYDVSAAADLSGYPDADKVQTYAQEAMSWAVAEGIVEGMDGNLNPAGNATRAQIATILMRFCEGVAK